jgi:hypothetical protein
LGDLRQSSIVSAGRWADLRGSDQTKGLRMVRGKMPPEIVWPFTGMVAGAVVGALLSRPESFWPFYVSTAVGLVVGFLVNAFVRR